MEQVRKQKETQATKPAETEVETPSEKADLTATDDLLDEIDAVLEENAFEFVRDFIQKGGE